MGKIQPPTEKSSKNFPFTYYRSWQGAFWLIFEKIFSFVFFHDEHGENAKPLIKNFGQKKNGQAFQLVRYENDIVILLNFHIPQPYMQ